MIKGLRLSVSQLVSSNLLFGILGCYLSDFNLSFPILDGFFEDLLLFLLTHIVFNFWHFFVSCLERNELLMLLHDFLDVFKNNLDLLLSLNYLNLEVFYLFT